MTDQNQLETNDMNTQKENEFMLLFRGPHWDEGIAPEEVQQRMEKVMAWFEGLQRRGIVKGGQPLGDERRIVMGAKERNVSDGPFAESKEAIGGYLVLRVDTMEEAEAIARTNPTLDFGISIEVRPVLEECPIFERARKQTLSGVAA